MNWRKVDTVAIPYPGDARSGWWEEAGIGVG